MNIINYIIECDPPKIKNGVELSIVLACRAESFPVLSMTLQSIQEECIAILGNSAWEVIIVFNSKKGELDDGESRFKESNFRRYGNFRYASSSALSSSVARSIGINEAVGRYVYIGDPHIIIGRDCFKYLMETHSKLTSSRIPVGILHSALGWMSGVHNKDLCDQYTPKIRDKFWGDYSKSGIKEPHIICMKGTSFLMLRSYAIDIGMYNLNFKSYGGNESYLNLKTWRFGHEVWVEPKAYIWHLAVQRGYSWNNDEFWFNQMLSAYTIGGYEWIDIIHSNYVNRITKGHSGNIAERYLNNLSIIYNKVKEVGEEDRLFINKYSKYTLDELMLHHGWR